MQQSLQTKLRTDREEAPPITSPCYAMYLLMLDMFKAFDTVDRAILLRDFKTTLR